MDTDPFDLVVCGGADKPAGFASTNPQNDKFCYGGVSVGGGWPISHIALLTGMEGRRYWNRMSVETKVCVHKKWAVGLVKTSLGLQKVD